MWEKETAGSEQAEGLNTRFPKKTYRRPADTKDAQHCAVLEKRKSPYDEATSPAPVRMAIIKKIYKL